MKNIVIWGAGKIGRGFAAEIFKEAGYKIIFVDNDAALVNLLNERKKYLVYKMPSPEIKEQVIIDNYTAYSDRDEKSLNDIFTSTDLVAVSVFPGAFESVGAGLAKVINDRANNTPEKCLDIIVLANALHAGRLLKNEIEKNIPDKNKNYLKEKVGINESIVIRMAVELSLDLIKQEPLVVMTNGYSKLTVDSTHFIGEKPVCSMIEYTDKFEACEKRKLYTYNMIHALFAYTGVHKGLKFVYECVEDEDIMAFANGTLEEISRALQAQFGFSKEEMDEWNTNCIINMTNLILMDNLQRVGADPVRKLKYGDRLAGPTTMCKKNGIMPYWLTKTMAYAFLYNVTEDESSVSLRKQLIKRGIKNVAAEYCGFENEPEIVHLIADRFNEASEDPEKALKEDQNKIDMLRNAWESGFYFEKIYKGCAQCTLLACRKVLGIFDSKVFESATAFSGGMALCGDGVCGGYSGGLMAIGLLAFRSEEDLQIRNKVGQYKAYELAQMIHDKFYECYGSLICSDIHKRIFGKSYLLRIKENRYDFEKAGAHIDKCTAVISMAMYWLCEIINKEKIRA